MGKYTMLKIARSFEIGPRVSVKIGAALLNKLMQSAKVENPDRRGNFFLVDVF